MAAEIDAKFEALITYLLEHQDAAAEALITQATSRPWMNFASDTMETPATDRKETTLHEVFKRDAANEQYVTAREKPPTAPAKAKEVAVPKLCGDYLAGFERDKRAQWRSRIRLVAHAASRAKGNGQKAGPLRRNSLDFVQRVFLKSKEKEKKLV